MTLLKKKSQQLFRPMKTIDPLTGKEKIVSGEEQEEMLERGILVAPAKIKNINE